MRADALPPKFCASCTSRSASLHCTTGVRSARSCALGGLRCAVCGVCVCVCAREEGARQEGAFGGRGTAGCAGAGASVLGSPLVFACAPPLRVCTPAAARPGPAPAAQDHIHVHAFVAFCLRHGLCAAAAAWARASGVAVCGACAAAERQRSGQCGRLLLQPQPTGFEQSQSKTIFNGIK